VRDRVSAVWRRSTFCADTTCVEVAVTPTEILMRDAKNPARQPLAFDQATWQDFVRGVESGEFDPR
jgi:predicted secreted Zn-dependent protease